LDQNIEIISVQIDPQGNNEQQIYFLVFGSVEIGTFSTLRKQPAP
jgi:hypothetical protein